MRLMMTFLSLFMLSGCAAGVKPMTTPDGKPGFLISCDGSVDNWATCYNAAIAACKGPYTIIDRNESSTPTVHGPMVRRHLVAACNAPPAAQ